MSVSYDRDTALFELVDRYIALRSNVRRSTAISFSYLRKKLSGEAFLSSPIGSIRVSDAKKFFADMQAGGSGFSEIRSVYSMLKLSAQIAVDDEVLVKNPFCFPISQVVKNDSAHRGALTGVQRDDLLSFAREDSHFHRYYDVFFVLFHTGLRISEFCGLTVSDVDFRGNTISVERQLLKLTGEYIIEKTKTGSGCRTIPMTKEVKASMICLCRNASCGMAVDGVTGFLTADRNGNPTTASHWEHRLSSLVKKYNRTHEPCLPHITPHVCRHTFCTLMAEQGLSLKTLQYLMGHSDVRVTMEVYTHVNMESVKRELLRAEGRKR